MLKVDELFKSSVSIGLRFYILTPRKDNMSGTKSKHIKINLGLLTNHLIQKQIPKIAPVVVTRTGNL